MLPLSVVKFTNLIAISGEILLRASKFYKKFQINTNAHDGDSNSFYSFCFFFARFPDGGETNARKFLDAP